MDNYNYLFKFIIVGDTSKLADVLYNRCWKKLSVNAIHRCTIQIGT